MPLVVENHPVSTFPLPRFDRLDSYYNMWQAPLIHYLVLNFNTNQEGFQTLRFLDNKSVVTMDYTYTPEPHHQTIPMVASCA